MFWRNILHNFWKCVSGLQTRAPRHCSAQPMFLMLLNYFQMYFKIGNELYFAYLTKRQLSSCLRFPLGECDRHESDRGWLSWTCSFPLSSFNRVLWFFLFPYFFYFQPESRQKKPIASAWQKHSNAPPLKTTMKIYENIKYHFQILCNPKLSFSKRTHALFSEGRVRATEAQFNHIRSVKSQKTVT